MESNIVIHIPEDSDTDEDDIAIDEQVDETVDKTVGEAMDMNEEEHSDTADSYDIDEEEDTVESIEEDTVGSEDEEDTIGSEEEGKVDKIEDLWSSFQLEKKYDEMKEKKALKDYLNLHEWKMAVRRRFREFVESRWFRANPEQFIKKERSKRNKDQYAVIDDTALNLVEYYHLKASKEQ